MPTSNLVSTVNGSNTFVLTYVTNLPHEVNSASKHLVCMVPMDQPLQVRQLRRYSSAIGHQHDVFVFAHWDAVAMRTTEHDPACLRSLALSDVVEELSRKASTWLYKQVEGALRPICPRGHDEWMALQKGPKAH